MQPFAHLKTLLPLLCGTLLATLSAVPSCHAQTAVTTTTWAQSYGFGSYDANGQPENDSYYGTGNDVPAGITPMPDGGVVVAGQLGLFKYVNTPFNPGAGIVRYDRNGAIVWQTLLRQDNDGPNAVGVYTICASQVTNILTDASGNIFVAGGLGNGDNSSQVPFIAKFAPDGTLVWQFDAGSISILTGTDDQGQPIYANEAVGRGAPAMDLTSDGGVIIGTQVADDATGYGPGGSSIPMLIKVNADGTLGFHREYATQVQYSTVVSVCHRPDGPGYAMLLVPTMASENDNGGGVVVVLTDAAGNPVTQSFFHGGGCTYITPDASGGYFVLGAYAQNPGFSGSEVRKLRADLTPVWQKLLSLPGPYDSLTPAATLRPTSDGGCTLGTTLSSGAAGGTNGAPSALLLTLDGTGAVASAYLLGGPVAEGLSGQEGGDGTLPYSCLTTDGAIAFAVSTFSYATGSQSHADWWVVKANASGEVAGFAGTIFNAPARTFTDTDSTEAPAVATSDYGPAPQEGPTGLTYGTEPALILENLATETGLNVPTVKFQAVAETGIVHPPFFTGEVALGNGVYYLSFQSGNPFGYYSFLADTDYIYHFDLGYEFVFDAKDGNSGVYLYDFTSNDFFYTSPSFPFPYLYDFGLNTTLYYYPDPDSAGRYNTNGVRYFYRFDTGQIFTK